LGEGEDGDEECEYSAEVCQQCGGTEFEVRVTQWECHEYRGTVTVNEGATACEIDVNDLNLYGRREIEDREVQYIACTNCGGRPEEHYTTG
jgi:hypothetical protein